MFVGAYMAAVSMMVTLVAMMCGVMSLATAFATELAMRAARNVVLAVSAFVGFFEHIVIAELTASRAAHLVMMLMSLVMVLVVHRRFVMNLATVLVVLAVMLFGMFFVNFVAMCHFLLP